MRWLVRILVILLIVVFVPPLAAWIFGYDLDEGVLPPRGREIRIGENLSLNVLDTGSGPPVVLVHGLPSSAYDWAGLPNKLAALGHRVLVYDRIGYGYSSRGADSPDRYTYQSNASDLVRMLDVLGIPRAAVVGWSYGGAVVETFAQRWPDRVTQVVLVAAVGPKMPVMDRGMIHSLSSSQIAVPVFRWIGSISPLSSSVVAEQTAAAFFPSRVPIGWVDYTRGMMALPGTVQSYVLERQRSAPSSLEPEKIAAPTLIIHGRRDKLVPVEVGQDLDARIPDSRLSLIDEGGHMLPVTHADVLAKQIHQHTRAAPAIASPPAAPRR